MIAASMSIRNETFEVDRNISSNQVQLETERYNTDMLTLNKVPSSIFTLFLCT